MRIAFYGSSLLSSYWNGAATYYRGILRELAERGHDSSIATSIRLNGRAWLSILPRPKR